MSVKGLKKLMSHSVVVVDAVRTPFGKSGSLYSGTRADDLMVRAVRGLLERNPKLSPSNIDDVAIAAATQTGDQGMNLGRSVALLAGLPTSVPGYAIDRWCAGALTAVTTISSAIAFGAYDFAIAGGVEHMGNHPIGDGLDPNPRYLAEKVVEQDALSMGATAERLHDRFPTLTKERADRYAFNSQMKTAAEIGLRPVMTLTSNLIAVRNLEPGDRVGYGGTFVAERAMTIGVVACGYGDGYPRHAPTGTPIMVNGRRTHTVGRVSMDKICVDLTDITDAGVGSPVTLWGEGLSADDVATSAGTVSYELFCALSARVPVVEGA